MTEGKRYRHGSILWYVVGAIFFILAGLSAIFGVASPYALPVILVVAGAVIVFSGLFRYWPSIPALVVFIIGIIVLAAAASGTFGPTQTRVFELTRAQVTSPIAEIALSCKVSTGSIRLSFTSNNTILYRIAFASTMSIFFQTAPNATYSVNNQRLTVNASATLSSVDITLNQNILSSLDLVTATGSIRVEVPPAATRVRSMVLTATTGEVWFNASNTFSLESIVAATTTGQVEAHIKSSLQQHNAQVRLSTTTGRVGLDLNITNIECRITAATTTGRVNADDVSGFIILSKTTTNYQAQTSDYATQTSRRLNITAITVTGNVDITAHHT